MFCLPHHHHQPCLHSHACVHPGPPPRRERDTAGHDATATASLQCIPRYSNLWTQHTQATRQCTYHTALVLAPIYLSEVAQPASQLWGSDGWLRPHRTPTPDPFFFVEGHTEQGLTGKGGALSVSTTFAVYSTNPPCSGAAQLETGWAGGHMCSSQPGAL